jgi:hypothetical protein
VRILSNGMVWNVEMRQPVIRMPTFLLSMRSL